MTNFDKKLYEKISYEIVDILTIKYQLVPIECMFILETLRFTLYHTEIESMSKRSKE